MRSTENIKNLIKRLHDKTTAEMDNKTLRDVFAAMPKQQTTPKRDSIWRTIMHSKTAKIAAGFIIVFGILFGFKSIGGPGTSPAFANAMEKFTAAKTAAFDLTIEFNDQKPQISKFLYTEPGFIRQDMANGVINIVDYPQNKVLSLDPNTMTAELRDIKQPGFDTALYDIFTKMQDMIEQAIQAAHSPVESLGTKTIDGHPAYGFKAQTTGQSQGIFWQGKGTLTIWADKETDFPLQLQWHNTMTNIKATVSNIGLDIYIDPTQFSFELPEEYKVHEKTKPEEPQPIFDPKESTETQHQPAELNEIPDPNLAELLQGLNKKEQILIKMFHSWTILSKGRFPSSLTTDAAKDLDPEAMMFFKQKLWSFEFRLNLPTFFKGTKADEYLISLTKEEQQQVSQKQGPAYAKYNSMLQDERGYTVEEWIGHFGVIGEGFNVINTFPSKTDWNYNGKGANLGDADTAIFWYKPKDSKTFRVIYGDLKVDEIEEKDLHLLETPSDSEVDSIAEQLQRTAIQLGADIPKDKRAKVLRILSLKEKDLIKGLATYLQYSEGTYPPSMDMGKAFMKDMEALFAKAIKEGRIDKKTSEEKVFDIFYAGAFYDKLKREKRNPAYYGDTVILDDPNELLLRWKLSSKKERVIYTNLKAKTIETQ